MLGIKRGAGSSLAFFSKLFSLLVFKLWFETVSDFTLDGMNKL